MITSMTGYANLSREFEFGALSVELRAVNHRFLDVSFRLPEELRNAESALREQIGARLTRGKVDCRIGFTPALPAADAAQLNPAALEQLVQLDREVRAHFQASAPLSVAEVLRWPGVLITRDIPLEALREAALTMLKEALDEFQQTREREGAKLKALLLERVCAMEALARNIAPRIPQIVKSYQDKLAARLAEANLGADDERLRQEFVLFASKVDVDEELDRLLAHLTEIRRILDQGGAVGKRLDFLMQELNREANTLGSKSAATEVSQVSVELKVLIEQMREQIQNIE